MLARNGFVSACSPLVRISSMSMAGTTDSTTITSQRIGISLLGSNTVASMLRMQVADAQLFISTTRRPHHDLDNENYRMLSETISLRTIFAKEGLGETIRFLGES